MNPYICELEKCSLYLKKPVLLPCGSTICQEHIVYKTNNKFVCEICRDEHQIPSNGFPLNKAIEKMLNLNLHLTGDHKLAGKLFDDLKLMISDYLKNNLINAGDFIFEYFSNLRNKIDIHSETMIRDIKNRSLELIEQINKIENECKQKKNLIENIDLSIIKNDEIKSYHSLLRLPNIDKSTLADLVKKMNKTINDIKLKIKAYKCDLLNRKNYRFLPYDSKVFGDLLIEDDYCELNNDCGRCVTILQKHLQPISCLQIIKHTEQIVSSSEDKTIKIWSPQTSECMTTLYGHQDFVSSIQVVSNNILLSGSWDCSIKIWDLDTYSCIETIVEDSEISRICLLDESLFAAAKYNGYINYYNLNDRKKINTLIAHKSNVSCLKLITKDELLSSSNDGSIKLWTWKDKNCIQTFTGHIERVYCLETLNDDKIISGSDDKSIKIWNKNNGNLLNSLNATGMIYSLLTISNNLIVIGTNDKNGFIQIIDIEKSNIVKEFYGHSKYVVGLQMLSNNNLVSASGDGTIRIWNI